MRLPVLSVAIAAVLVLAGCASSKGLQTTGTVVDPSALKSTQSLDGVPLSATAWPQQDWWVGYGDAQLTALIDEALKNNPSLDEANARARMAQATVQGVNAARKPQVAVEANATGARLSEFDYLYPMDVLGHFAWSETIGVGFDWDLDLWGGKRDAWEAALGRSRAAALDAYAARIELSVNVARAYVRLNYAFAQKDVADAELERSNKLLHITQRMVEGGLGTPQQNHMADSQVASAEQQVVAADRAIDAARSSLSVLLGAGPDRGLAIGRPSLLDHGPTVLPEQLSVDLIGRRTDLVAARWEIEAADKNIKAAKDAFLPNISIQAMAGYMAVGDNISPLQWPAHMYELGPALSLPIFDGGRRRAHLSIADSEYDALVARYNRLLIKAMNEVADEVSALKSIRSQITLEQRAVDDAQKSWDDAMKAYQGGLKGPLTPLTSRQQLLAAQQRLALLQSEQIDLSIRLVDALGGGFDGSDDLSRLAKGEQPAKDADVAK